MSKIEITTKVFLDRIEVNTETVEDDDTRTLMWRELISMKERSVHDALVRLGWTPPGETTQEPELSREFTIDTMISTIISHYGEPKGAERHIRLASVLYRAGFRLKAPPKPIVPPVPPTAPSLEQLYMGVDMANGPDASVTGVIRDETIGEVTRINSDVTPVKPNLTNWRNWKHGDVIKRVSGPISGVVTVGNLYVVDQVDVIAKSVWYNADNGRIIHSPASSNHFEFHHRPGVSAS